MKKISWLELNEFKVLEIDKDDIPNLTKSYILEGFGIEI